MKNRRWTGKRSWIVFGAVALILTALVVPYACAGTTGAVPFSGDNPSSGTRTVTIADITDFHGHIERGADNATAFTVADSHNPGNMIPVSTGDLVGGSPYESAVEKDQPTLDMAKAWGLTISAIGNHEFDRGVADFNNRIADPSNGIDWLCANASAANKSPDGLLSHVRDSTIRTVNGKRIGFVGALTDALGSVATPQITRDADLDERAVDAINRVARELNRSGKVDAVVALLHADASAAADIGRDVDVVYTGHSHAIKRGTTAGGAPIYEAGSFGRNMAVQDLIITGAGRRATVRVADVDLGNGTSHTAVDGVLGVDGLNAHPAQAAWMSAGAEENDEVSRAQHIYQASATYANHTGSAVIGTLASGVNFDKQGSDKHGNTVGVLVADANRESIMKHVYAGNRLPVIGFSNNGSLRTPRLDMNGDGKVTVREVDSLMALQFKAAHETLTGRDVKRVLAEQFRRDDGRLERRWLGISSNVTYRYAECGTAGESGNADAGVDTDSGADTNADADECAADEHAAVRIANLAVDGRPIADDDLVIIASNSYLLQGGDSYPAFRAGTNYGELDMPYSQPLHEYLAAHQGLTAVVAVPVGTQA